MEKFGKIIAAALVCVGLCVVGVCISGGLKSFSNRERVVAVKGLAEKLIKATEAKITISASFSDDIPSELTAQIKKRINELQKYLAEQSYKDIEASDLNIYDSKSYYTQEWDGQRYIRVKKDRYYATQTLTITISAVEQAEETARAMSVGLITKGWSDKCDVSVNYLFPELNEIKPELIAESTHNARLAGEQFAKDSQSTLGKIKTASQGQITIVGRYYDDDEGSNNSTPEQAYYQKARVVSTIVFYLQD